MFKGLVALALVIFAGGYFAGAFGPQSYSRTVSRPPQQVMAALENLDLTAQPGAPGSTAEAAGGIKPMFRLAKTTDSMTWYVMSGEKVATAMTASFAPIDGGKATRISTRVERGDASDDFVSPAFRSKAVTMGLFSMAIEGEVNKLIAPPAASADTCDKLMASFGSANWSRQDHAHEQGFAESARMMIRLNAMEAELRRNGCNTNSDGTFRSADERAGLAPARAGTSMLNSNNPGSGGAPNFKPGEPILDPTPHQ